VAVITHTERKFKMSIKGPLMFPAVALVDPDLLTTLPASLVASTGMDALTHAIEGYTVKPASPITDIFARASLKYVFQSIEEAFDDIQGNDGYQQRTCECHQDTRNPEEQENLEIYAFPEQPDLENVIKKMKNSHHKNSCLDIHEKESHWDQQGRATEAGNGSRNSRPVGRDQKNNTR
jgi:hypothetical protein